MCNFIDVRIRSVLNDKLEEGPVGCQCKIRGRLVLILVML
jgi:hypothetical protein